MAAGNLRLEIATPERLLVQDDATEVYIPAANGMIGILPEHAPLLSELGVGELAFTTSAGPPHRLCGGRMGAGVEQRSPRAGGQS